jgi:hypothetical protein
MRHAQDGVAQRARDAPDRSTPTAAWPCRESGTSSALSTPGGRAPNQPRRSAHFRTAREKQAPPRRAARFRNGRTRSVADAVARTVAPPGRCGSGRRASPGARTSSNASAAATQHVRSLLHQCRRRLPATHRRRDVPGLSVTDAGGDRDCPAAPAFVSLTARNTSRESAVASRAELDPMRILDVGGTSGKGHSRTHRPVPQSAPSLRHITGRVLRDCRHRLRREDAHTQAECP